MIKYIMPLPTIKNSIFWVVCIGVLFASISIEFYGRACGFLFTFDSFQYLSAAHSFSESGKFLNVDGSYYASWPPLFPLLLSFFKEPRNALAWINVACKIILALTLLRTADLFIKDSILKIIFLTSSLIGVHVTMISVFVWSELIFMTFIFLNAYFSLQLKNNSSNFYWLLITGFLACLQRNAGLFWISGVCAWLLLDNSLSLKTRIIRSAVCFIVCTSGLWAWNIYNTFFLLSDFNFYKLDFFSYAFFNLKSTLNTFGKILFPFDGIVGILFGILFFVIVFLKCVLQTKAENKIQFFGIVLTAYTIGFLIMPGRLEYFDMDRYFSVITPIVYLFFIIIVQEKLQSTKQAIRVYIYIVVVVLFSYPIIRTFKNVQSWHERSCVQKMKDQSTLNVQWVQPNSSLEF